MVSSLIRISTDHGLFATPRSFSQLVTSFFGAMYQGILLYALCSLIFFGCIFAIRRICLHFLDYTRLLLVNDFLRFLLRINLFIFFVQSICFFCLNVLLKIKSSRFHLFLTNLSLKNFLCSCQSTVQSHRRLLIRKVSGGNKWTRTTDLTLIRRVL